MHFLPRKARDHRPLIGNVDRARLRTGAATTAGRLEGFQDRLSANDSSLEQE